MINESISIKINKKRWKYFENKNFYFSQFQKNCYPSHPTVYLRVFCLQKNIVIHFSLFQWPLESNTLIQSFRII